MNDITVTRHSRSQCGYFAVLAILFIMIIGFIGSTIAYMLTGNANSVAYYHQGEQALYIAEAGFEEAGRLLLTPNLSGTNSRIGCASLSGNTNLTNKTFGTGTFTATAVASNPVYTSTTLSSALTATSTTIPVASTTNFASAGRIMIDSEVISYGGISGSSFVGIQRGANESYNTPHTSGAPVSQYQCTVDVLGGIPNLTSATYKREIHQALPLQEGWAVGAVSGGDFVFTRWNRPTEVTWTSSLLANAAAASLSAISMLSNADGWAVGSIASSNYPFLHWNGSSWTLTTVAASCATANLTGVTAVYNKEAFAVGLVYNANGNCNATGKQRFNIFAYNGTSWTQLTPSTTPSIPADNKSNVTLNAVHVIDATQSGTGTIGFAVGDGGIILEYNGSNWVTYTSPTTNNLYGVYVVSATQAWAVGAAGTILKWNGTAWSTVTSPTTTQLNAVSMQDTTLSGSAETGWAVGNSGVSVQYNGSTWVEQSTGTTNNLFGVDLFFNSTDAWAVGAAGTMIHWNGTAWSAVSSGETVQLNAISLIAPQQYPFAWEEIYA